MVTLYCRSIFIKSVVDHTQVVQDVSLTEAISTLSMDNQSLFVILERFCIVTDAHMCNPDVTQRQTLRSSLADLAMNYKCLFI